MNKIQVDGTTVDFFEFKDEKFQVFTFNTETCQPPEPMVNAMLGLQLLNNSNQRLEMINHKSPVGLFPKIENDFNYDVTVLDETGKVKVVFTKKETSDGTTDFKQNNCDG